MKDIYDIKYNDDGTVTVIYTDGTSTTSPQTGGGYTTGSGTGSQPGYSTGTGKKWWETLLSVFPAILGGIFGNNSQPQTGTNPYPVAQPGSGTSLGGNMNTIIIIAVAVLVIVLLMKKR